MKQVQIPIELFAEIYVYFNEPEKRTEEAEVSILNQLNEKLARVVAHNNFTKRIEQYSIDHENTTG